MVGTKEQCHYGVTRVTITVPGHGCAKSRGGAPMAGECGDLSATMIFILSVLGFIVYASSHQTLKK